jgi:tetratricopeptide (TPR) repeat protein
MRTTGIALLVSFVMLQPAAAQEPPGVPAAIRELFQAGQYQPVIDAVGDDASPAVVYLAALSHQKLGQLEGMRAMAQRLTARPAGDPWHGIGQSVAHLAANEIDPAIETARMVSMSADAVPQGHFQLGLALARREAWRDSAVAFDRAGQLDPQDAYAFYYAGLSHYRAGRRDLMAVRFERFLKLAPDAPERPEVVQIMRTIRGR